VIDLIETLAHYLVAVVFLVIVGVVLSRTASTSLPTDTTSPCR